jgi:putative addiction module killer protein
MIEVRKTDTFSVWLDGLRDLRARARVQARIERLACGNAGDIRSVGEGVFEMRIDYGAGYRVYFARVEHEVVVLLAGGFKLSQSADILAARRLKRNL